MIKPGQEARITDSIETALRLGNGRLIVHQPTGGRDSIYSERLACEHCGPSFPDSTSRRASSTAGEKRTAGAASTNRPDNLQSDPNLLQDPADPGAPGTSTAAPAARHCLINRARSSSG